MCASGICQCCDCTTLPGCPFRSLVRLLGCTFGHGLGFRVEGIRSIRYKHVSRAIGIVLTGSRTDLEVVGDVHVCSVWSDNSSVPASTTQMETTICTTISTNWNKAQRCALPGSASAVTAQHCQAAPSAHSFISRVHIRAWDSPCRARVQCSGASPSSAYGRRVAGVVWCVGCTLAGRCGVA